MEPSQSSCTQQLLGFCHNCSTLPLWHKSSGTKIGTSRCGERPVKVYLGTLKFTSYSFHMSWNVLLLMFFNPLENRKNILSLKTVQKQILGRIWASSYLFTLGLNGKYDSWNRLSILQGKSNHHLQPQVLYSVCIPQELGPRKGVQVTRNTPEVSPEGERKGSEGVLKA